MPSSSTPRESGSHSDPVGPGPRRGGRRQRIAPKMIETWASEALAGSRTTRTSRAPMVAASGSAASSISSAVKPGRQAKAQALAGRDELGALDPGDQAVAADDLAGDEHPGEPAPGRPVPQRRGQPSARGAGMRQTAMPTSPRTRTPEALAVEGDADAPEHEDAEGQERPRAPTPGRASAIRE